MSSPNKQASSTVSSMPDESSSPSSLSSDDWKKGKILYRVRSWDDPEKPVKVSIEGEDDVLLYFGDVDLSDSNEILYKVEGSNDGRMFIQIQRHSLEELVENTSLSEREAELYILHKERGHNLKETAEKMGVSYGSAKSMMSRIRKKITRAENTATLVR